MPGATAGPGGYHVTPRTAPDGQARRRDAAPGSDRRRPPHGPLQPRKGLFVTAEMHQRPAGVVIPKGRVGGIEFPGPGQMMERLTGPPDVGKDVGQTGVVFSVTGIERHSVFGPSKCIIILT